MRPLLLFVPVALFMLLACGKDDSPTSVVAESVQLNKARLVLLVNQRETLVGAVLPTNATDQTVRWKSSDPQVAAVSTTGKVTALVAGNAYIVAIAHNGKSAACDVAVLSAPGVALNKTAMLLKVGASETLVAAVYLDNDIDKRVTWTSSAPQVATVDTGGRVSLIDNGVATITATTSNGKSATCVVTDPPTMVLVGGGTFTMGCTAEQGTDCHHNETPSHSVMLSDYYIGKYEVTQTLWKAVMGGNNPSSFKGDNLPVESVSWDDVQTFIKALNYCLSSHYRLPTEAEWEYAARGGRQIQGYKYSGSNTVGDVAWYAANSGSTHVVGTKAPNELGIYDMSGNVSEWCQDWYGGYSSAAATNPTGPSYSLYPESCPVIRGGGWGGSEQSARVFNRGYCMTSEQYSSLGFRLAHSVK